MTQELIERLEPCPACEGRGVYDSYPIPPDTGPAMEFECCACDGTGKHRPPVVTDEVVERVIQIVRKHDRDYDRNRMDTLPAQHAAEGLRRKLAAAIASMPAVVSGQSQSARIAELEGALSMFMRAAYPVAPEINKRRHNWRGEDYLDAALANARASLTKDSTSG